jgi:hypothetical protein
MQPTACLGLANDIVSVVTGQLYDERDQFHLQVQASCVVPTRNEVAAFDERSYGLLEGNGPILRRAIPGGSGA